MYNLYIYIYIYKPINRWNALFAAVHSCGCELRVVRLGMYEKKKKISCYTYVIILYYIIYITAKPTVHALTRGSL